MASSGKSRAFDRSLVFVEAAIGVAVVAALVGKAYGPAPALFFLLSGAAAGFTGWVIVRMVAALRDPTLDVAGRVIDEEREMLEHEKLLLLQGIKELEADRAVGKVDGADYQHLRSTAERRAAEIITRLKRSDERWLHEAEELVAERLGRAVSKRTNGAAPRSFAAMSTEDWAKETPDRRRARSAYAGLFDHRPVEIAPSELGARCGSCASAIDQDAVFCVGCGRRLSGAREGAA